MIHLVRGLDQTPCNCSVLYLLVFKMEEKFSTFFIQKLILNSHFMVFVFLFKDFYIFYFFYISKGSSSFWILFSKKFNSIYFLILASLWFEFYFVQFHLLYAVYSCFLFCYLGIFFGPVCIFLLLSRNQTKALFWIAIFFWFLFMQSSVMQIFNFFSWTSFILFQSCFSQFFTLC